MGEIAEGEEHDIDAILEDIEDHESNALHHNYDMINLR